jgi:hypothetical protein
VTRWRESQAGGNTLRIRGFERGERNLLSSAKKDEQDRGDLFGSIECAIEKTHRYEGDHKESDNQGDQKISCNYLSMEGNHLLFA